MGFFKDLIFGSKPKKSIDTLSTLSPEQRTLMNELLIPYLSQPISEAGQPAYTKPLVADIGTSEQAMLDLVDQLLPQYQQATSGALDMLGRATSGATDIDEYFKRTVQMPMLEAFDEEVTPRINARYAQQFYGSDRKQADQRAVEELLESLTTGRTSMAFNARENDLNRLLTAAQATPGILSGGASAIGNLAPITSTPRQIEQMRLAADYDEFVRQQDERNKRIQQILTALGLQAQENIATVTPGTQGLLQSFLGSEGGSKAIGGMF